VRADASAATAPVGRFLFLGWFTFKSTSYLILWWVAIASRGETRVNTVAIPLSFSSKVARCGRQQYLDPIDPVLRKTLNSPDFVKSAYSTGFGQFGDACSAPILQRDEGQLAHTLNRRGACRGDDSRAVRRVAGLQLPDGTFLATLSGTSSIRISVPCCRRRD